MAPQQQQQEPTLMEVLEMTVNGSQTQLQMAMAYLEAAAKANLVAFMRELASIMSNVSHSAVARMQAGLQLKNLFHSKDEALKAAKYAQWRQIEPAARHFIKQHILAALGTEQIRPSSAAICIAVIFCAETTATSQEQSDPQCGWPELIPILLNIVLQVDAAANNTAAGGAGEGANATSVTASTSEVNIRRLSALEAIGYILQDIDPDHLRAQSNEILTAIVFGMRVQESSHAVRHAATNALLNSLEFTKDNFANLAERNCIMSTVCQATQSSDAKTQEAALEVLVRIMSLYYPLMEMYMSEALYAITVEAMQSNTNENAVLQGIEFWSTVCDEEIDLSMEALDAEERGQLPTATSRHYALGALNTVLPILFRLLIVDDATAGGVGGSGGGGGADEDEWNPNKAAGVCIMLFAQCCGSAILEPAFLFINENLIGPQPQQQMQSNPDWRFRDAAMMTLGSIMEGPNLDQLRAHISDQLLRAVLMCLNDPSEHVVDTTAWTLGKLCEMLPEKIVQSGGGGEFLQELLNALLCGLQGLPKVAANVCWALGSLARAAAQLAATQSPLSGGATSGSAGAATTDTPHTFALSPYFGLCVEKLLCAADRTDCSSRKNNLRNAAYSALMDLMRSAPRDCLPIVEQATENVLVRLHNILQLELHHHGAAADGAAGSSNMDKEQIFELESLLCGALQSVLSKMERETVLRFTEQIMLVLMTMFSPAVSGADATNPSASNSSKRSGAQEDALLAVSALVDAIGGDFLRFLPDFVPVLMACLENSAEHSVCLNAIGLLGDLCRNLTSHMLPFCAHLFDILMRVLMSPEVNKTLRPYIVSAFGDMAMSLGVGFQPFLGVVLDTLEKASAAEVDRSDVEMLEYLNELRNAVLEAYVGVIQGMSGGVNNAAGSDAISGAAAANESQLSALLKYVPHMVKFVQFIGLDEITHDDILCSCCGLIGDIAKNFGVAVAQLLADAKTEEILAKGRRSKVQKTKQNAAWATKEVRRVSNLFSSLHAAQQQQQQQQAALLQAQQQAHTHTHTHTVSQ